MCTDCISGRKPDQRFGQCSTAENDLIEASHSESEFHCFTKCAAIKECKYYTWFSLENEQLHQECLLFATCENVEPCEKGCYIGSMECGKNQLITPF